MANTTGGTAVVPVQEHIFGEERAFAQCHASTLVRFPNGRFLAAWFGGAHEKNPDVAIWRADRSADAWSSPRVLAKVSPSAHWNPVLFLAPDGRTHLYFKVGDIIDHWRTWTMVSDDEGVTWSEPRELVPGDIGGRGPVKNKPIALQDGTWLAGASIERGWVWDVFVDRSDDGGCTWQATDLIPLDRSQADEGGVIQPTIWESSPGRVHMLMRSTYGRICRSDSDDSGRTWSAIYQTDLVNNNSGIDLARLDDGTLALVCNPVTDGRTPLSVLLSMDNGQTWPRRLDLETDPGEYSYPAIIAIPGGMAITYTWHRERIAFRILSQPYSRSE